MGWKVVAARLANETMKPSPSTPVSPRKVAAACSANKTMKPSPSTPISPRSPLASPIRIKCRPLLFLLLYLIIWSLISYNGIHRTVNERMANANRQAHLSAQNKISYCSKQRGSHGQWELDWNYAKTAQYATPGSQPPAVLANYLYKPTDQEPFRRATAYKWVDDKKRKCPVSRIMEDGRHEFIRSPSLSRLTAFGLLETRSVRDFRTA